MPKTVLVVEDSAFVAEAIRHILEAQGFRVLREDDGRRVLDAVKEKGIDLVILDLMMPKLPGKEVLVRLKKDPQTKKVPVIILSARLDHIRWDDELKSCDLFMPKPFRNDELVANVKKLLKQVQ